MKVNNIKNSPSSKFTEEPNSSSTIAQGLSSGIHFLAGIDKSRELSMISVATSGSGQVKINDTDMAESSKMPKSVDMICQFKFESGAPEWLNPEKLKI